MKEAALGLLSEWQKNLEIVSFDEITDLMRHKIRYFPFSTAIMRKGAIIERVRFNEPGKPLFKEESEISYIRDPDEIKLKLKSFGRCNKPFSSCFYGSIRSDEIKLPRMTALSESRAFSTNIEQESIEGDMFTVGRWVVKKDFVCAEIIFAEEAILANNYIRSAYQSRLNEVLSHPEKAFNLRLLKFYSEEFAKTVEKSEEDNYKISAAISELVFYESGVAGIIFPSVATGCRGLNVALKPSAVNSLLEFELFYVVTTHGKGKKFIVNEYKNGVSFDEGNKNFKYKDSEIRIPIAEIQARLNNSNMW